MGLAVSKVSCEWLLTPVDPAKHCYRWYRVHIQATLLDPFAVVCAWGSLRTKYRRQRSGHQHNGSFLPPRAEFLIYYITFAGMTCARGAQFACGG